MDIKISLLNLKKKKKWQYDCEHYKNLSEVEEQELLDYRKNIESEKMPYYNYKKLLFQKIMT